MYSENKKVVTQRIDTDLIQKGFIKIKIEHEKDNYNTYYIKHGGNPWSLLDDSLWCTNDMQM